MKPARNGTANGIPPDLNGSDDYHPSRGVGSAKQIARADGNRVPPLKLKVPPKHVETTTNAKPTIATPNASSKMHARRAEPPQPPALNRSNGSRVKAKRTPHANDMNEKKILFVLPDSIVAAEAASSLPTNSTSSKKDKRKIDRPNGEQQLIFKAKDFTVDAEKLASKFTVRKPESNTNSAVELAGSSTVPDLPIQNIAEGIDFLLPDGSFENEIHDVKNAVSKRLKSLRDMPSRRCAVKAASKAAPPDEEGDNPTEPNASSSSQQQKTGPPAVSKKQSLRQQMMSVPPHRDEKFTPEQYMTYGNVVWGPSVGEFPAWPVVITRVDVAKKQKRPNSGRRVRRKLSQLSNTPSPSKNDAAFAAVNAGDIPITKKLFHYVYLEPDYKKFLNRVSWKRPYQTFKRFYPEKYRSKEEQLHILAQMRYFAETRDTVTKNNLPCLYRVALQMADLYNEKKFLLPGITSHIVARSAATADVPVISAEDLLIAVETMCWIGYIVFCNFDDAYLEVKEEVPDKVKRGFEMMKITCHDIFRHFKVDVDDLKKGDLLPCIDKIVVAPPPPPPNGNINAANSGPGDADDDADVKLEEPDADDAASDVTVAEYRHHRFCIAPWLLPKELANPDDVEQYENDEELNEKHDKFVDEVIEICKKPATERFLQRRLDVGVAMKEEPDADDDEDTSMYWRLEAFLNEGGRSARLQANMFLLPINNQQQRAEWDDMIEDWFITFYRDCHVKRITECESDVEKKMLVDLVVVPLLWVYAVSQIRSCSLDDAEKLISKMLD